MAIPALLDAVGQVFCNVLLEPAQKQGAQFCGKPAAGDALLHFGVFHSPRLVGLQEMRLVAEVTRRHKIHDAPQVQQAVLQRRAGERQTMIGFELFDRLRHLRAGVLDELGFIEDYRPE